MSTLQETINNSSVGLSKKRAVKESIFSRSLNLLCSVRFGVILLILLGLACLMGMLVMQQNVDGFERYYAELTPSQRLVYGFLGFFDIYHVWYFNALLVILSLNIILSSFDRFPKTFTYISKPNLTVPTRWLKEQNASESIDLRGENKEAIIELIRNSLKKVGWKKALVNEKNGKTFVFAQSGSWNRLGAYTVHVALLTIFLGGFLTSQLSQTGQLPLTPGQKTNQIFDTVVELDQVNEVKKQLPFEVICTDIQQKLIKKDGAIGMGNTIDWLTKIQIKDGDQTAEAVVQMNRPFDYRGYRFFQASFVPVARARNINVKVKNANTGAIQEVTIPRDGNVNLEDGTNIRFVDFKGNFTMGSADPNEDTSDYQNPAAILQITPPNGSAQTAYAFGPQMANIPVALKAIGGYTFQLTDFERVGEQHILAVQRDPGANVVYAGFALLSLTLVGVFFFSHQRVWAAVEETSNGNFNITLGGHTNRNQTGFDERFKQLVNDLHLQIEENK